jgi:hypothetical protein
MAMFLGALTKDGKLALRLIYAHDQRDSYRTTT